MGDRFQVGLAHGAAAPVVHQQALGDMGDQGARLLAQHRALAAGHQAHEGVLCQVGRIAGVADLAAQPSPQPAVMVAVQGFDRGEGERVGRGQDARKSNQ
ncbi:hypothetical protein D3C87_1598790 [compost metagenome]